MHLDNMILPNGLFFSFWDSLLNILEHKLVYDHLIFVYKVYNQIAMDHVSFPRNEFYCQLNKFFANGTFQVFCYKNKKEIYIYFTRASGILHNDIYN